VDTQGVYESRTRYLIFLSGSEEGTDDHGCALIKRLHILWYIGLCNYVPRNSRNQETGTTFDLYIEKIIHSRAIVLVDGKWYARLNHYDYGRLAKQTV